MVPVCVLWLVFERALAPLPGRSHAWLAAHHGHHPTHPHLHPAARLRRSTLIIAADCQSLRGALDALTASPLQCIELEAEEVLFTDDSGATYTGSRRVAGWATAPAAGAPRQGVLRLAGDGGALAARLPPPPPPTALLLPKRPNPTAAALSAGG